MNVIKFQISIKYFTGAGVLKLGVLVSLLLLLLHNYVTISMSIADTHTLLTEKV